MKRVFDKTIFTLEDSSGRLNLFALAMPLFFQQVFSNLLGTVGAVALTKVSEDAVTAVNVSNMLINVPTMMTYMITSGTLIILSLSLGAGEKDTVGRIFVTAVISSTALSLTLSAGMCFFAPSLLTVMNLEGNILDCGVLYFRIRILSLALVSLTNCITAVLRAHGYSKPTMVSGILTSAVNVAVTVFVVGKHFDGNKIAGVAVASVLGQLTGFIYAFLSLKIHSDVAQSGRFSTELFKRIISVGIPSGMSLFAFSVSTVISTSVIASLGQSSVNIKVYTSNISQYTYIFGYVLAQSGALMIGRYVGGGNYGKAKQLFRQISYIVPVLNFFAASAVFFFTAPLMRIFTDDPHLIAVAHTVFLIDIAIEISRGNTHVGENSLCSVTDTLFTSIVSILSCIFISALGCWLFSIKLGFGIYGFYIASLLDETTRGILYRIRWNKSKWIDGSRITAKQM